MKYLITGGAGFIGSHLVNRLAASDHEITVLDSFETSSSLFSRKTRENVRVIHGSIQNDNLVASLIKENEQIIHLAAAVGVANIIDSPLRGLNTNVLGSEVVIRNCATFEKPLFFTSSSEIYGKNTSDALDELSDRVIGVPQKSRWSYSDSKAIEEAFAFAYQKEMNLEFKAVRLFNTVGPGQSGDYGMVLPRLINSALSGNDLIVYGNGQQTRCFMHVDDAINGILMMLKSDVATNQVYNLGHPSEISIIELARKVIAFSKSKSKIELVRFEDVYGPAFEDMERRVPNIEKARRDLDWWPKIDIDEIIRQSVSYQTEVKASEN